MSDLKDFCGWSFFVDTGGTFTDCLGLSPQKEWFRAKVLSRGSLVAEAVEQTDSQKLKISDAPDWPKEIVQGFTLHVAGLECFSSKIFDWDPSRNELTLKDALPSGINFPIAIELSSGWEAPVLGMRLILSRNGLDWNSMKTEMRLATTRCTNALLEGKGTRPVLFTTAGFADLLEIGDQRRTDLFDLIPQKRKNLAGKVIGVHDGIINFTIGQRKGIKVSNKDALYVIKIDSKKNEIIVGPKEKLGKKDIKLNSLNLLVGKEELKENILVKVRSTGRLLKAKVNFKNDETALVVLKELEDGISPGQACVFYKKDNNGEKLLGGGWITL